ncbi:LCP family protein [Saliterribacillus persicus]|uniref:LytR family transcriptional attenuator n=1 Tax=Saliterribacillus persicus TaxID=930114 RepID=A0A368YBR9_9BACI|nr:LCP family protein [Saliterribacillus persicus]RCW76878.1 LytR family transcriptional attenuator [Saliterribacillus persicus]
MDNNFKKELFSYMDEEELIFSKEDRKKTINKIQEKKKRKHSNNTFIRIKKGYLAPILGTAIALIIAIGLLLPNLNTTNEISQENTDKQQATEQEDISFSALLMSKDSGNRGSDLNILITYNSNNDLINLISIPPDTYVDIFNPVGKVVAKDKLLHASAINLEPEPVLATVSNLFDLPIDYYSVIPIEEIYTVLGITKDSEKVDIIQKNEIGNLIKERLSISKFKSLLEKSETNIPRDINNQIELSESSKSINVIDMKDGLEEKLINEIYYVEFKEDFLETISNDLKQHLNQK